VVLLSAGSIVPADGVVIDATDCYVNQAILTGESFPVEKSPEPTPANANVAARTNCVFLGTNVRSGSARVMAVETGPRTQFGAIAHRLSLRAPETEFDRGVRHYGYLLATTMLMLVVLVLSANVWIGRPVIQTLLFSVALAVGLSPELLPAIINVNLARGAQMMARHGVLVRRLSAIENLGSMDVLCTDKTGTLTEGVVRVGGAYDEEGNPSADVLELAAVNASLQTGMANPLDEAIQSARSPDLSRTEKVYEIPYDFVRKRLSVIVRDPSGLRLLTKGAVEQVLHACQWRGAGNRPLDDEARHAIESRFAAWSGAGLRVLAVAGKVVDHKERYGRDDECGLTLLGFLTFVDRPKEGAAEALADMERLGVNVKVITGDARLVALQVASAVGMQVHRVLTGRELDELHDDAVWRAAEAAQLFVEVDPNQKERIILALKKCGHVVGFLGDGVNDAPAMHAADTSLSVDTAADVAKDAADFVLLDRHLHVIRRGIVEGRKTFANTLKYILITTSANLGNMISMAVASLFLPFLPLLASQVLLNNFLSDIPAVGLADDAVDEEWVSRPRRWDMRFIWRFMVEFGLLSSAFDALTFGTLIWLFAVSVELFRTGWFVESLLTELLIALIVRTRRPFHRSRPGRLLTVTTAGCVTLTLAIPYLPGKSYFGFTPLPWSLLVALLAISVAYVAAAEVLKRWFYRGAGMDRTSGET
jgi:Mg2+-importing ATPase